MDFKINSLFKYNRLRLFAGKVTGSKSALLMICNLILFNVLSFNLFAQCPTPSVDGNPCDWNSIINSLAIRVNNPRVDPLNSSADNILSSGAKDVNDFPLWHWANNTPNDKTDIKNAAVALLPGDVLWFAADRFAQNGDAQIGFWLLKSPVSANSNFTFTGQHTVGDLFFSSKFTNGGGVSNIVFYKWVGGSSPLQLLGTSGSMTNSIERDVPTVFQSFKSKFGANNKYPIGAFFEGSVTLPPGVDDCFTTFLVETSQSQSDNESLSDFLLGSFATKPTVRVNDQIFCSGGNATFTATVESGTGVSPFTYEWKVGNTIQQGVTGNTLTLNNQTSSATISVVAIGANGCRSNPATGSLTILPLPTVAGFVNGTTTSLASPYALNGNQSNPTATLTATSSVSGTSFTWTPVSAAGFENGTGSLSSSTGTPVTFTVPKLNGSPIAGLYAFDVAGATNTTPPCPGTDRVYIRVSSGASCPGISGPATICANSQNLTYTAGASSPGDFLTYVWSIEPSNAASIVGSTENVDHITVNANSTNFAVVLKIRADNGTIFYDQTNCSYPVTINDITPGTIAGDQTLCTPFDPAAFTSTTPGSSTAGGTISYQWQSSTSAAGPFSNILNANSATYDAPAVSVKTYYRRVATSTLAGVACSDNSNVIAVTPNDITPGEIAGDQTLCTPFDPAAFTSTTPGSSTAGGTISYQWQSSTSAAGPFSNILNANSATYDAPAVSVKTYYRRVATSTLAGVACSDNSNVIAVTPNDITPGEIAGDQTLCTPFDPAAFTSTTPGSSTAGGTISYQWQSSTSAAGPFSNILNANSATYDAPAVSVKTYYRRVATSTLAGVACSDNSNVIAVTPNDITPGEIAGDQTLCTPFDPAAFTSTTPGSSTAGGTISYQWQSSTSAAGPFSNILNANSATYDAPAVSVKTYYRRVATSTLAGVACSDNSNVIAVTPNDITPGEIAGDQTVCFGDDPAAFTSTTPGSSTAGGTISYQWQSSTSAAGPFSNILNANSATYDPPVVSVKTYYRRVATSTLAGVACSDNSNVIAVDLKQCIFPHLFPTQTTCCNYLGGNTANFQLQRACITLSGNKISNATPGVFFYYGSYKADADGVVTIKVDQTSETGLPVFLPQGTGGGNANVLVGSCQSVPGGVQILAPTNGPNAGDVTFTFTAVAGSTYVVLVKYDMKSIVGKNAPSPSGSNSIPWALYDFDMKVNNSATAYQGSFGQLPLFASGTYGGVTYTCNPNENMPSGTCPTTNVLTRKVPTTAPVQTDDLQVAAYPNPYNSSINFQIASPIQGKASLEVYDLLGRKLAIVYQGNLDAGKQRTINYKVPSSMHVPMIYKLRVGNKTTFGKLLPGDKE